MKLFLGLLCVLIFGVNITVSAEPDHNMIANGGFEEGNKTVAVSWGSNGWGGADAESGRKENMPGATGKYCFEITRKNKKGGLQLFSPVVVFDPKVPVDIQFRFQGECYFQLRFVVKKDGKYVDLKNNLTGKGYVITKTIKSDQWDECHLKVQLPNEYQQGEIGARLYFLLFPKHLKLTVDDVQLIPITEHDDKSQTSRSGASSQIDSWLAIHDPKQLTPTESSWYSPFPDMGYEYGMKDGVLTRDGVPFFYAGNFTVGGGQWNVASSWLSRVLKNSYSTVTWSIGNPSMNVKPQKDQLVIDYKDTAPLYSWIRELARYGQIVQFDPGNAMYKYNPIRYYPEKFPGLNEFFVDGSHFYCFDHNTEIGRRLYVNSWKNYFKYIRDAPLLAFECFNELGYRPRHPRVLKAFRVFSQKKYSSLKKANVVWGKNFQSWDKVIPPHIVPEREHLSYGDLLYFLKKCHKQNMYYDWLMFLQEDLIPGLVALKNDFRAFSNAPFSVDWRGHHHEFDGYATLDLDALDDLVDIYFLHNSFLMYDYNGAVADEQSVLKALSCSLLPYNFVASNSDKPFINPESIYSMTATPGSSGQVMAENSFGKFEKDWQFKLEDSNEGIGKEYYKVEFDDSDWGKMAVPGCWDATEKYKGKNGWGWYRTTFNMPSELKQSYLDGSRKFLIVGKGVAQSGTIWLNGHKVGDPKGWNREYKYDVGAYLDFGGENTIAILVDGTESYSQGLRFYIHVLADDMLNERHPLGEKEYASILWTNAVSGCSGITLWNWEDALRLFMPKLLTKLNSVTSVVLPAARKSDAKVAMLMPYLYFRGLPRGNHLDYMSYFAGLTFLQAPVDVLSEKQFQKITLKQYPMVVVPYAEKIHRKTYQQVVDYLNDGGHAIVTFDSLKNDFEQYTNINIQGLAGVRILGTIDSQQSVILNGKSFKLIKDEEVAYYGVKIDPVKDVDVVARFTDGTPAITAKKVGRGRLYFVAGRLDLSAVTELLKQTLEHANVNSELNVVCRSESEFSYIQAKYLGDSDRFVMYIHNWGGTTRHVNIQIGQDKLHAGQYRMRNIYGPDQEERVFTASELTSGVDVIAPSMSPVAFLLETASNKPLLLKEVSPIRQNILTRLEEMNATSDFTSNRPKALFMDDVKLDGRLAVGRKLYPLVQEFMEKTGCGTAVLPWQEFTPENLKKFDIVFLGECISSGYNKPLRSNKFAFTENILNFVRQGGSLILVSSSAHPNARHALLRLFGKELGFSVSNSFSRNPLSCGYGDPVQIRIQEFTNHPLTESVNSLQMFITQAINLKNNSPLKPVAMTSANDLNNPSKPVVVAGRVGKGKIVACTDLLWLQPFRLEDEDNARFLMNIIQWSLGQEGKIISKSDLMKYIFIDSEMMNKVENN